MSFLADTVLPGTTRLHHDAAGKNGRGHKQSQGNAPILTPLIQLVKDPVGVIGSVFGLDEPALSDGAARRNEVLYARMRNAKSYDEWKTAASELDVLEGNDSWKHEDDSPEYDAALVASRLQQLDEARIECDVKRMLFLIRTSLTRGLGGMGRLQLYKHSHIGTKRLIERYIDSAQKTMAALLDVSANQGRQCPVDPRVLVDQLLEARQSFGRSALLLSGGGTFGMNHIGVVKCLWHARLLPRIISGASAGSIVCAVLCSRTDAEIPAVLERFCYGDLAVFEKEGEEDGIIKKTTRFLKYGALFDISYLVNVMRDLLGDMTFQESYNRTRRILNITVSSASVYELPRLLNYITAPNVMIWSAVCASCSVPFVFSAASLLAKDPKTGKEVPWNPAPKAGWIDGSVDNDLPMTRLAEIFNVNHFIVSQVNPHVVPFLAKEEDVIGAEAQPKSAPPAGPSWINNLTSLAKGEALHRLQVLSELGIFPNYLGKARSVLNQRYSGDITIFPSISYAHFPKVLSNPTSEYMLQSMLTGERATWPKLSRIQNHVAIELALDETIHQLRARVVFSPSQVDLRLNDLFRPVSHGNDSARVRLGRAKPKPARFELDSTLVTPNIPIQARRLHAPRIQLPTQPLEVSKPYLPSYPIQKHTNRASLDSFLPSTNAEASSSDGEFSGDVGSDTSEIHSPSSPPHSPSGQMPTLWPSTRQVLFSSSSQPATPTLPTNTFGHQIGHSFNLTMTSSAAPSSPELRYKRLFHPAGSIAAEPSIHPEIPQDLKKTILPLAQMYPVVQRTESVPEDQRLPATALSQTDSLPEADLVASESALFTPALSPISTKDSTRATATMQQQKPSKQEKQDLKEMARERGNSRRGNVQGLELDISGTRGMMLRKRGSKAGLPPT